MKILHRTLPLIGSALLLAAGIAGHATADPAADLADDARVGRFSGIVASVERGDVRLVDARGDAMAEGGIANGSRIAYPLASVTKLLTATAVMRLVEDGLIDLDAPVEAYLPDYAGRPFASVTIAQLLSHTGGVPSLLNADQGLGDEPLDFEALARPTDTNALIGQFSAAPLLFEPGARYGYSNSGYILLGRIIEVVTGEAYYDALDALVLAPAGVSGEFCLCRDLPGYPDAMAFEREGDGFTPAPVIDPTQTFAAAGLRATPEGVLRWGDALMSGHILNAQTLEQMWTPVARTRRPGESFALGWLVREVDGLRQVSHDGAVPGAVSYLILTPAADRGTFGALNHTLDLDNLPDSEAYLRHLVSAVVAGRDPATVPALATPSAGGVLTGSYRLPGDRSFSLQLDGDGQLWFETDGHWSALQLPKLVRVEGPLAQDADAAITGWATIGQQGMAPYFSPDMLANVPEGALDGTWIQLTDQFGAYRRHHVYAVTAAFAEVRIEFERGAMDIGIVYDEEGRINGLQPVGQETEMPALRVRAWMTADGGLWIDGFAHSGPDVAATLDDQGALVFDTGDRAVPQPAG